MKTFTFPSSSSDAVYTVTVKDDGAVSCNCRGWTVKRGDKPRECKHTREVLARRPSYGTGPTTESEGGHGAIRPVATGHSFVQPMLAVQMDKADITDWTDWAIEEKFDGHRAMVMVVNSSVTAWSRSGKRRELPPNVAYTFASFPNGIYDGEVMGKEGGTFADARRVELQSTAYFVVFDVVNYMGDNVCHLSYDERRRILRDKVFKTTNTFVRLAPSSDVRSEADVVRFTAAVWERGGEGAILKLKRARYQPGKRSDAFVKVKQGGSCVTVVTGFKPGERGPFSRVCVRTVEHGIETTVKNESKLGKPSAAWVGKELRIEYTAIRDGAVVNPRSDRWEAQ
jgi:ATP-dependent DNA ligase